MAKREKRYTTPIPIDESQLLEVKEFDGVIVKFMGDCIETPEQLKIRDRNLAKIGVEIYTRKLMEQQMQQS